jgi:hypothetical protein
LVCDRDSDREAVDDRVAGPWSVAVADADELTTLVRDSDREAVDDRVAGPWSVAVADADALTALVCDSDREAVDDRVAGPWDVAVADADALTALVRDGDRDGDAEAGTGGAGVFDAVAVLIGEPFREAHGVTVTWEFKSDVVTLAVDVRVAWLSGLPVRVAVTLGGSADDDGLDVHIALLEAVRVRLASEVAVTDLLAEAAGERVGVAVTVRVDVAVLRR